MAEPIEISLVRDVDYLAGDVGQLQVDGDLQHDRVSLAAPGRERKGYGFGGYGTPGSGGYGFGVGLPYGSGVYGRGYYGQGAEAFAHETVERFVAGDYLLRVKPIDEAGNEGAWAEKDVAHRPDPPAPEDLAISGGVLSWTWTDD